MVLLLWFSTLQFVVSKYDAEEETDGLPFSFKSREIEAQMPMPHPRGRRAGEGQRQHRAAGTSIHSAFLFSKSFCFLLIKASLPVRLSTPWDQN